MDDTEKQEKLLRMMEEEQKEIRNSAVNQKKPEQLQESLSHSSPKLIKCSDCGKEVSIRASACPHCGSPVDLKYQKAEVKKRIKQEEKVLSEEEEQLEKKIAKLKKETEDASNNQLGGGCLVYVLIIISFAITFYFLLPSDSSAGWAGALLGLIISINLSIFGFSRRFLSEKEKEQIDELKVLESRLEENKKDSEKLTDNLKNINSPKVFATLAAGYGLHQMRDIRQELGEINEGIADGGGDASGGDGGGGEADFSSFM